MDDEVTGRYRPGGSEERARSVAVDSDFNRQEQERELPQPKAQMSDHAKSVFLSRMSHEMLTPLNAILGFGQILQLAGNKLTEEQDYAVKHIISAGEQLLELIEHALDG